MRILVLCLTLAACGVPQLEPKPDPIVTAAEYVGLQERDNRQEIIELTGVDPVRVAWCAAFVNAVLDRTSIPGSDTVSEHPLLARSFLNWGEPVDFGSVQTGDIVVFPRGQAWQGHVGFYVTTLENGEWLILGGNQDNRVGYKVYDPNRVIAIRRSFAS